MDYLWCNYLTTSLLYGVQWLGSLTVLYPATSNCMQWHLAFNTDVKVSSRPSHFLKYHWSKYCSFSSLSPLSLTPHSASDSIIPCLFFFFFFVPLLAFIVYSMLAYMMLAFPAATRKTTLIHMNEDCIDFLDPEQWDRYPKHCTAVNSSNVKS